MPLKPITVSQLNEYIDRVLQMDPLLSSVRVKGETSRVNYNASGHVYFSLIDQDSQIRCFLPRDAVPSIPFQLEAGMALILTGSVSVYRKGGSYSLRVETIEREGEGALQMAFEALKRKLDQEGLFAEEAKKPLPVFPRKVGVITSGTGAAVRDILKNIAARNQCCDVTVYPVPVQGQGAAEKIAAMIDLVNRRFPETDVLIVGRGGGSPEDLQAFNEEVVARAVFRSKIPVISAVGHAIDHTICDMAADVSAETPTKAGVRAVPDTQILSAQVEDLKAALLRELQGRLDFFRMRTDALRTSLLTQLRAKETAARSEIDRLRLTLEYKDPRKILAQGYTILTGPDGRVIPEAAQAAPGDGYQILFRDGKADANLTRVLLRSGEGIAPAPQTGSHSENEPRRTAEGPDHETGGRA